MPGLLRGVARTAVVAGTATAVSGRVQRRQAERYADSDAQIAAERDQAYDQQVPRQAEEPSEEDRMTQLQKAADLHSQGVLTDAEFAAEKQRILGS
ncbi:MAG: SHOCT domain-containing protein [Acidimicrobiia bacterium]|nr:SHOCT domain-containing protein [Acidimicrobiia bacterium]